MISLLSKNKPTVNKTMVSIETCLCKTSLKEHLRKVHFFLIFSFFFLIQKGLIIYVTWEKRISQNQRA